VVFALGTEVFELWDGPEGGCEWTLVGYRFRFVRHPLAIWKSVCRIAKHNDLVADTLEL